MLSSDEVKWIMAEAHDGETLPITTLCSHCYYNLRGLSYEGVCPECGRRYNAVPLVMEGVFIARQTSPPVGMAVAAIACTVVAVVLIVFTLAWVNTLMLVPSIAMIIAAERYWVTFVGQARGYRAYLAAMKRLASEDLAE